MQTKAVRVVNRDGKKLAARLDLPVDEEPIAYALFAHCFTCTKNLKAVQHISRGLTDQGIGVVRFDFTGLGESEGEFADSNFSSNIEDLVDVARFMAEEYDGPSILVGHSLGGAAVLQAAGEIPSATAVVTIAAPFRPDHVLGLLDDSLDEIEERGRATVRLAGRPFTIQKQFLDDLRGRKPREAIEQLDRALLIFHSPLDNLVSIDNAADIFTAAKHPKSFVSLDEADHLLSSESDSVYLGNVLGAWARKYIEPAVREAKYFQPDDNRVYAVTGESGYLTRILANGHPLVADEPKAAGGTDAGPSPYDYVVAGLGACTGMTLRMYADRKEWPLKEVTIRLRHQKVHASDCSDCDRTDAKIDQIE
ncbi:MAG: alpha/beta fold hydrolase, partial [Rhodothermales bacterium]